MKLIENKSIKETRNCFEKKDGKKIDNIYLYLGILMLVFGLGQIISSFIMEIFYRFINPDKLTSATEFIKLSKNPTDYFTIFMLLANIFVIFILYIFAKKSHSRSPKSLGLRKKFFFRDYFLGIILGIGSVALAIFLCLLNKSINLTYNPNFLNKTFILFILARMVQGFTEEFVLRGILMNFFAIRKSVIFAIIANSLIFSLLHIGNDHVNFFAVVNLFLFGLFASLLFYLTDSIRTSAAFHSFWNFAQGNFFGLSVSGGSLSKTTVFTSKIIRKSIFHGGDFGLEAGLASFIIMIIFVGILVLIARKRKLLVE